MNIEILGKVVFVGLKRLTGIVTLHIAHFSSQPRERNLIVGLLNSFKISVLHSRYLPVHSEAAVVPILEATAKLMASHILSSLKGCG